MAQLTIAVLVFVTLGAIATMLYDVLLLEPRRVQERLSAITLQVRAANGALAGAELERGLAAQLLGWAARRLPSPRIDKPSGLKLAQMLAYAGYHGEGALRNFLALRLCTMLSGALGTVLWGLSADLHPAQMILYALAAAIGGHIAPTFFVGWQARKRRALIARELSDILDLLIVCVESGLGLFQAIRTVGREAQRQGRHLGAELSLLSGELSAGVSLGQGLRAMAERTGVEDVRSLAAILIQSEKLGSQIGPALRACSDSLRTKRRLRAEEAAQKATIKMLIPLVLFVLPAMMAVILGPAVVQLLHTFHR